MNITRSEPPSEAVIDAHRQMFGDEYRRETEGPTPSSRCAPRKVPVVLSRTIVDGAGIVDDRLAEVRQAKEMLKLLVEGGGGRRADPTSPRDRVGNDEPRRPSRTGGPTRSLQRGHRHGVGHRSVYSREPAG